MKEITRGERVYRQVFHEREREYEGLVASQLRSLIADHYILPFRTPILGDEGSPRCPDLVAVHVNYRMWTVIEVELEHHSYPQHVRPQVAAFATGRYEERHADSIHAAAATLDGRQLRALVKYYQPEVLVVVNSVQVRERGWGEMESSRLAKLMYIEVFRDDLDDTVCLATGHRPRILPRRICGARVDAFLQAVVCPSQGQIAIPASGKLVVQYQGRLVACRAQKTADGLLLFPGSAISLEMDRNYDLLRSDHNHLVLQRV